MRKSYLILIKLAIFFPSIALAKFNLENTNQDLIALNKNGAICVAKIDSETKQLKIINEKSVPKNKLMKSALSSAKYFTHFLSATVDLGTVYLPLRAALLFVQDDFSRYTNFVSIAYYFYNLGSIPAEVAYRRLMFYALLNDSDVSINKKQFDKILNLTPGLDTKYDAPVCTPESFKVAFPELREYSIVD